MNLGSPLVENIRQAAFQTRHDLLEAAQRDALLALLQTMKRRGGKTKLFGKLDKRHVAASLAKKRSELFFQSVTHPAMLAKSLFRLRNKLDSPVKTGIVCLMKAAVGKLLVVGLGLFLLPAMVQAQFTFTTNNGAITITGYTGAGGAVSIPDTINGLPVTCIGDNAFNNTNATTSLTNVTIANSIISIGDFAFANCYNLTSVTIPNGVTSIGSYAFENCFFYPSNSIKASLTIPDSVTNVGSYAFYFCEGLTNVILGTNVASIGDVAFGNCFNLSWITIPNGVTSIGDYAFQNCFSAFGIKSSITIPNSVTNVGSWAFYYCGGMTNIIIGNGVTSIGGGAFYHCIGLSSVTLPDSVISIGSGAFQTCLMTSVTIGNNVSTLGTYAFQSCTKLTTVTIPNSVKSIGDFAFNSCTLLTSATLGNSVASIGISAFSFSGLTSITIPNSVTSIGASAFNGCSSLVTVTIGNKVASLGNYVFQSCSALKQVYFKGNVPGVGSQIFYLANNATVYYMPGSTGWSSTFATRPTVLWNPQLQTGGTSFGVRTNKFGFNVTGTSTLVIVVEASTNLSDAVWQPIQTNMLTGGSSYFSDPQWTNYTGRFYRFRSP